MTAKRYWFPAREYGWGWGLPNTVEGWIVYCVFAALFAVDATLVLPAYGPAVFVPSLVVLFALLGSVCWLTGEPARWRWGRK